MKGVTLLEEGAAARSSLMVLDGFFRSKELAPPR